jgi:hypothetical protein
MGAKLASGRRIGSMRYATTERWNSDEKWVAMVSGERRIGGFGLSIRCGL